MAALSVERLRRVARKPPGYLVRRIGEELGRELQRLQLSACRSGRGPLTPARIVPGGLPDACAHTAARAAQIGDFGEAIDFARRDLAMRAAIERRAELAAKRRVELFGEAPVQLETPPAWNVDPHTGTPWPSGFHRRLDVFDLGRPTDVKLVWELSRLRHCVALAQAAAVLDDERALAGLAVDLADWRACNPLGWTVNWTVGMEVALRAVNMICIDGVLLAGGRRLPAREEHVACLYQHGWFLRRNLEVGDVNGNHFLANAVGLLWLGAFFGEIGDAKEWLRQGVHMVGQAADEQILDDGLDHEGSLPYHVLVTEMFLLALVVAGEQLTAIRPAVSRMLDAIVAFTDARGSVPDFGDDDGGRVAAFSDSPSRDARRVLALGAALLGHPEAAERSTDGACDDAIWLAGPNALERARAKWATPPAPHAPSSSRPPRPPQAARAARSPRHFPSAGLIVMERAGGDRVVLDGGPVGFRGRGGHGHLDALSLQAWLGERVAIRDSGTCTYTGDPALRNELRGVEAHSVVIVDGLPYARLGGVDGLWAVHGDSPPRLLSLGTEGEEQIAVLLQTLPAARGQATVRRRVSLTAGRLAIEDEIHAPAGSNVRQLVQLPAECELRDGRIWHPGLRYDGRWPTDGSLELRSCPYSTAYGQLGEAKRSIVAYRAGEQPARIAWSIGVSCGPEESA